MVTSSEGDAHDPMRKLAANELLVAGFSGDTTSVRKALDGVRRGEDLDELAKSAKGAPGLAVKAGRLYYLEDGLVWPKPKSCRHYAVGSGASQALAWLAGRAEVSDETIRLAHKYVAKVRDDCGRGVDFKPAP